MRNPRQSITLTLAQLQAAGNTSGGDFPIGPPLPADAIVIGTEIDVTQTLSSPNLTAASATITSVPSTFLVDLTTLGTYQSGGQQFYLSVRLTGDWMSLLATGNITATVYYIEATTPTYQMNEI
jgi:hypothetical protein